ncbi:MAG: PAS domain S-box protein [Pseudomonadota bacterium]
MNTGEGEETDGQLREGFAHSGGQPGPARGLGLASQWAAYTLAVALTLATLGLRFFLGVAFGERPLLILFVFPIIVGAHLGGLGPGLAATFLAAGSVAYSLVPPTGSFSIDKPHDLAQWLMLVVCGVLISGLNEALRRARRKEAASQQLQAATLAGMSDAVVTTDGRGMITFSNGEAERLTGWPQAEARGRPLDEVLRLLGQDDRQPLSGCIQPLLQGAGGQDLPPAALLASAGHGEIPVALRGASIRDGRGAVMGAVLVFHDISESQRAERALRDSEEKFRLAFKTSPDAININRLSDGLYLDVNDGFLAITGYTRQEVVGHGSLELDIWQDPADRQRLVEGLTRHGRVTNLEAKFRYKDGRVRAGLMSAVVLELEGQACILSITRDIDDIKKAQEELGLWANAFHYCAHGMAIGLPVSNTFLACNPAFANMLGYRAEEIVGRPILSVYDPAKQEELLGHIANADRLGQVRYESRMRRADGSVLPVQMDLVSVRDDQGRPLYRVATVQDITQRHQAEEALRQKEERLRLAHEAAKAGTWEWELGTDKYFWSAELWPLYGLRPNECEASYQAWLGTILPADRQAVERAVREAATTGTNLNVEWRVSDIEGGERWLMSRGKPIRDDQGRVARYLGIVIDVTQRKRMEQALERTNQSLATLIDSSSQAIIAYDPEGIITQWNRAAERIFGWTAGEAVRRFLPFIPPEKRKEHEALRERVLDGEAVTDVELLRAKKNGSPLWISASISPLRDPEGRVYGILSINSDITQRRRSEEEKTALEAQLRQAQKMEAVGTLAGGIAHDFNNILGAILGYSELAQELAQEGRPNAAELAQVLRAADRARVLVKQILTFSRKSEADLRPLSLNKVVRQAAQMLEHSLPKMIAIQSHLAPDLQVINADPNQMEQVLLNLATNAADAMPEGGRLVIETQNVTLGEEYTRKHLDLLPGQYVLLMVSDTGHGMENHVVEHIFDPFFTTKEVGKGTGLGLSTVYGIVKGHGGQVVCYSEPGMGTTFKIYLPVYQAQAPAPGLEIGLPEELFQGTETILLVDDEQALRDLGTHTLEGKGYRVLTAASGEEALEIYTALASEIDLVVMDLGMPGMGGHKTLKAILELNPQAKVVIASGYSANGQVKASLESGGAGFVAKPFRRLDLLSTVRQVLDKSQA